MPRLLSTVLAIALRVLPLRLAAHVHSARSRLRRGVSPRVGDPERSDAVEAPDRARARTDHHWPGEAIFSVGERRTVVPGRWRLSVDRAQRAQRMESTPALDPSYAEGWMTQLEGLLTLQVPGARLAVARADAAGWQQLELRAPTRPETVVQLDRAALAQIMNSGSAFTQLELRVYAPATARPIFE